jgi:hypothetical protein
MWTDVSEEHTAAITQVEPEDGAIILLHSVGGRLPHCMASQLSDSILQGLAYVSINISR